MNDSEFRSWLQSPSRTLIMGILNLTPDSFSDGGHYDSIQKALDHTMKMIECGADIKTFGFCIWGGITTTQSVQLSESNSSNPPHRSSS